jgi:hypothetical protein
MKPVKKNCKAAATNSFRNTMQLNQTYETGEKKYCKAAASNSFRKTYWGQMTIIFSIQLLF